MNQITRLVNRGLLNKKTPDISAWSNLNLITITYDYVTSYKDNISAKIAKKAIIATVIGSVQKPNKISVVT
ncbi:hypothetical protein GS399_18715 [Pedobacter sp. HMF7647]|uniref:Uncharacterized protein n=1 Tax=Hufsiella arboris TaxID=2695275 RepID=A0A7K1YFV2_9SPHI|nr:hypothetical protein [Hufsiella arboris]MXV53008.1 hypothetical protein [Hufsiella arboris]